LTLNQAGMSIESRIQQYLRVTASRLRDTERIGPFLATYTLGNANPFLNYAVPDDGARPSVANVASLIAAYEARSRTPRLEYAIRLSAAVEPSLLDAGFVVEGRLPLMTCLPGAEQALPVPVDIELVVPVTDAELLATVAVQNEAYGDPPPDPQVMTQL